MTRKVGIFWFIAALTGGVLSYAGAATYYVCDNGATCGAGWSTGSDSNSASQARSKTSPWKTIDKAEENVVGGDTVIVGDGVYSTGASEWSDVVVWVEANDQGSMITFKSENLHGAQLNGHGTMYGGLWFDTRYAGWVRFEDFEITNFEILGINSKDTDDTSPFARASRIEFYRLKIHSVGRIGMIIQEINDGLIDSCLIFDLTSPSAQHNQYHGIYISDNTNNITIRNNVVYGTPEGWPMHIYDGHGRGPATNHTVIHNTLINEATHRDGGMVLYGSGHIVRNNLMWNVVDAAGYSAAIYNNSLPSSVVISHNMTNLTRLCENSSTCGNATVGMNFLGTSFSGMFTNPSARDYALQSGVQAIDAGYDGLVFIDYAGNVRPQGAGADIGAFEFTNGSLTVLAPTNLRIMP